MHQINAHDPPRLSRGVTTPDSRRQSHGATVADQHDTAERHYPRWACWPGCSLGDSEPGR